MEMYDMEKITKEEFKTEARKGIYFFNSIWTKEIDPLKTIKEYILKIDNVKKYMKGEELRILQNDSGNLRFRKNNGSCSYINISGPEITIHKMGNFLIVYTVYKQSNQKCIVMYIMQEVIEKKQIEIDPELFIKELPHGSGIDCDWHYTKHKNGKVTFNNYFHAMGEHGYYDGYMPFKFTVFYDPIKNQFDFNRIVCAENKRKSFYGLKEYLEDTLYAAIVGSIDPNKHLKEVTV